jgi:hypothetical protein
MYNIAAIVFSNLFFKNYYSKEIVQNDEVLKKATLLAKVIYFNIKANKSPK